MNRGTTDLRKPGTSVKLNTFDLLGEEKKLAAKEEITYEKLRAQAEELKGKSWADISDDDENSKDDENDDADNATSSDSEEPEESFLQLSADARSHAKSKDEDKDGDINKLLSTFTIKATAPTETEGSPSTPVKDDSALRAQLRQKIAAAARGKKAPVEAETAEGETADKKKKKTKSEKKEAKLKYGQK